MSAEIMRRVAQIVGREMQGGKCFTDGGVPLVLALRGNVARIRTLRGFAPGPLKESGSRWGLAVTGNRKTQLVYRYIHCVQRLFAMSAEIMRRILQVVCGEV